MKLAAATPSSTAGSSLSLGSSSPVSSYCDRLSPPLHNGLEAKLYRLIAGIRVSFGQHRDGLPAEVRRDGALDGWPLVQALDAYLRDRVLDDFLGRHGECRQDVAFIFGCRYPYLWDLGDGDGAGAEPSHRPRSPGPGPVAPTRPRRPEAAPAPTTLTWVPDLRDEATAKALAGPRAWLVRAAVEALDRFEPVPDAGALLRADTQQPLSRQELAALEDVLFMADVSERHGSAAAARMARTELVLELQLPPPPPPLPQDGAKRETAPAAGLQPFHDGDPLTPAATLLERFSQRFREDARTFWAHAGRTRGQADDEGAEEARCRRRRLNMVRFESEHYDECMRRGPDRTAALRAAAEAHFRKTAGDGGEHELRALARFRGRTRAALQQSLNAVDNAENRAVWRPGQALALPPPPPPPGQGDATASAKRPRSRQSAPSPSPGADRAGPTADREAPEADPRPRKQPLTMRSWLGRLFGRRADERDEDDGPARGSRAPARARSIPRSQPAEERTRRRPVRRALAAAQQEPRATGDAGRDATVDDKVAAGSDTAVEDEDRPAGDGAEAGSDTAAEHNASPAPAELPFPIEAGDAPSSASDRPSMPETPGAPAGRTGGQLQRPMRAEPSPAHRSFSRLVDSWQGWLPCGNRLQSEALQLEVVDTSYDSDQGPS